MIRQITLDELTKMRETKKKFFLVDVLATESYNKEHIPGALSIPLAELKEKAAGLLRKDATVVVYCASYECKASTMAAETLQGLGFNDVLDYKGGLKEYRDAHLPLAGGSHENEAACTSCCSCD